MKLEKIRILHITNNLGIGGVQKIIYQLSKFGKQEFSYVCVASSGGVYEQKLKKNKIDHYTIPDLSSKKPKELLEIQHTFKKIIVENDINVIHCHHRMAVLFAKIIGGNRIIIYNNHTIYSDKPLFSKHVLKNVKLIADGAKAKDNLTEFFNLKNPDIVTINNAVDSFDGVQTIIPEIQKEKEKGYFIVMNAARLHPQKGMNYYIDAAQIICSQGYKIKFFIVGDGPLRDELIEQVKKYKLENDIIFLGFRNDIKNTISQCDVLVLSSVYEGLPLTPMEAFSVKKAVIGTNIDGTKEVIKHGYNGLLAETKNPESIANAIIKIYKDSDLLNQYNENAYKDYVDNFSIKNFREKYLQYYSLL